jgi:hypothetical protein
MPTRKQRRRDLKSKRHEYEFVYVDESGNELDDIPEELLEPKKKAREEQTNGAAPAKSKAAPQQTRGGRPVRVPPAPSWSRSIKRAGLLGIIVFLFFTFMAKGGNRFAAALLFAVPYTLLFIPVTYVIDRAAYRRWQARQGDAAPKAAAGRKPAPAKKRR